MNPFVRVPSRLVHLAAIAATAAALAACAAPQNAQPSTPSAPVKPAPAPAPTPAPTAAPAPVAVNPASQPDVLPRYFWALTKVTGADGKLLSDWLVPDRTAPTLAFQQGNLSVQNLCNLVSAAYTAKPGELQVNRPISTMRACVNDALMKQERNVANQLPLASRFEVTPAANGSPILLTLTFADGMRWELMGAPTPETRYGSAGERIFMEVAPDKVNCNHPLMRDAKCLRVRDLRFDASGVKHVVGDWRVFSGNIEGYNFEPGIRNVVRVNRYDLSKRGPVPADASRYAYVLDMVVESERMR